jgi:sec-independent protein translocase protein TatB
MFGIGTGEMMLIAAIAIVVIGPDKLPQFMRMLGKYYGQIRRTADELRRAFILEADRQDAAERYRQLQERRKAAQEARKKAQEAAGATAQPLAEGAEGEPAPAADGPAPNDIPPDAPHPSLVRDEGSLVRDEGSLGADDQAPRKAVGEENR